MSGWRRIAWAAWALGKAAASAGWWVGALALATLAGAAGIGVAIAVGLAAVAGFAGLSLAGRAVERRLPGGPPSPDPLRPTFLLYLAKAAASAALVALLLFGAFALFFGDPIGGYSDAAEQRMLVAHRAYMFGSVGVYALLSALWNRMAMRRSAS